MDEVFTCEKVALIAIVIANKYSLELNDNYNNVMNTPTYFIAQNKNLPRLHEDANKELM